MLDWLGVALIGILQGLLEWLPVSSSGQTVLVMVNFLGIHPELAISMGLAVHIGTALAVVVKYPRQLARLIDLREPNASTRFYWVTTTVSLIIALPLVILLQQTFESELWTGMTITLFIGLALIFTGLMLSRAKGRARKPISAGGLPDHILLGIVQGVAVLPGISRSGMTVSALLMRGYKKTQGLVFSFLLSVPVSIASALYFLVFGDVVSAGAWLFVIAVLFSFVFGYLSMEALVRVSRKVNFSKFCIFFGGLAVVLAILLWLVG